MTSVHGTGLSRSSVFVAVVRRSGPHLLEASLIPTGLFYGCLVMAGLGTAYAAALIWLYASVLVRVLRHRPIPPLLVLAVIGITVRTTVSITSGSSFVYFAQPVANSLVMAGVFLISIVLGRPLIEKLALEFWPLTPELLALPSVTQLLRGLTFLWAGVNLAMGLTTLTLLLCLPLATYVAVKQFASLAITGTGIAITIDRAMRIARQEGYMVAPDDAPGLGALVELAAAAD
jgi:intracellular septation protein A